jgi:hypothetical protein
MLLMVAAASLGFLFLVLVLLDAVFSLLAVTMMLKSVRFIEARVQEGVLGQERDELEERRLSSLAQSRRAAGEELARAGEVELARSLRVARLDALGSAFAVGTTTLYYGFLLVFMMRLASYTAGGIFPSAGLQQAVLIAQVLDSISNDLFVSLVSFGATDKAFLTVDQAWATLTAQEEKECALYDAKRADLEALATPADVREELLELEDALNKAVGTEKEAATFTAYKAKAKIEHSRCIALMDSALGFYTLMKSRWRYLSELLSFDDATQEVPQHLGPSFESGEVKLLHSTR